MNIYTEKIHSNDTIAKIYERTVEKFFDRENDEIVTDEIVLYVQKQLRWKKQDLYEWGLPLVKAVCDRIGESFENYAVFVAPEAENYRDLYFEIFGSVQ